MAEKERRVFAGYYKRYDGKHIFVVTTAKDYESQEDTVIFYTVDYKDKNQYVTMPLKDFNAKVKHCTLMDICETLSCGHDKATKMLKELEMYGLISRQRQGKGRPTRLYVHKFQTQ